ncbi:MAG: terminase large subunit [Fusobacteriaceae bacterium]
MTILDELVSYTNKCIAGEIISGKKHIWACKRFLKDINNKNFKYTWNEEEANKIVIWFKYLKHSKGVLSGKEINLTSWQKFCLCQIYGWRDKQTGNKRFKSSFIEVARKQAKSQMQAGILLYEMSVQATKNNEIYETYCAGTKREQSKIIFNECANLLNGSILATKFKINKNEIIHIKTRSFLKPLSKEDGRKGDGTNPAVLVLDEYHQHKTTEFYDLGLGSNTKESMLMIITTAGVDLSYPCYTQEYKYCSDIINPGKKEVINDEYFVDICEIDVGDDITNEENWKKANPLRMYYQTGVEQLRASYKIAKDVPEKMIAFMTKCLNLWVQAKDNGYMDMGKWNKCKMKKIPYDLKDRYVYVGFDMSAKIDLTSVAFVIPLIDNDIPKYAVFTHSFIPNRDKLRERIIVDKVPYDSWEKQGYLTITDTPIVDQEAVMNYVKDTCKNNNWNIKMLCFDPANSSKLMMDLSSQGYECVEVFQSHKSLNESTQGFREQVYSGNIMYLDNPLLNFSMGNAVIKQNNGLIKIDKDASIKRIDPVDAILCGYKLAQYHEFELNLGKYAEDDYLEKLYSGGGD